ncbi:uncharacterized protein LOC108464195 isoform X2 [Gossypium arboreum]|uniref:uncharacterized protein LOC108464195 isoform X2 n=1 Tax=Gossypium arboreum TaxID=29729 RepID=UPI0022F199EF|nr:uncharacterized protein LOC108464195 isoform X2 [Gossypium arboreum]
MILVVLFANSEGNILVERSVYIFYMTLEDVNVYVVGKDEYDELASGFIFEGLNNLPNFGAVAGIDLWHQTTRHSDTPWLLGNI